MWELLAIFKLAAADSSVNISGTSVVHTGGGNSVRVVLCIFRRWLIIKARQTLPVFTFVCIYAIFESGFNMIRLPLLLLAPIMFTTPSIAWCFHAPKWEEMSLSKKTESKTITGNIKHP